MVISNGFCSCGCGLLTTIAKQSNKRRGHIKGKPIKFIIGHNTRRNNHYNWNGGRTIRADGYMLISMPNHSRSNSNGYIFEHILIAEKAFGKPLPDGVVIHHHTRNQLVICQDQSYHILLHNRMKAYNACGKTHWRKCQYCQKYDDPINLYIASIGRKAYHNKCRNDYRRMRNENSRTKS